MTNVNLAFHAIIYIMVFLFPGVLFRRAFFSGRFKRQFDAGNPFERLLWSVLLSIICLSLFTIFVSTASQLTDSSLDSLFSVDVLKLLHAFKQVYTNNFPDLLSKSDSLVGTFLLLAILYLFSASIGYILYKIVFIFGLEKKSSFFRFLNKWDYITVSTKQSNSSHKSGDTHYTKIDVKTNDGQLFTGNLHEIILDKEGAIEAVALRETYKFITLSKRDDIEKINEVRNLVNLDDPSFLFHLESSTEFIYQKRIKGSIFTIFNDRIDNMSITFIKIDGLFRRLEKVLLRIVSIIMLLVPAFSISYIFWDYGLYDFSSFWRRLAFGLILPINVITIIVGVALIYKSKKANLLMDILDATFIFALFLIPYLYILDYTSFWQFSVIFALAFAIFTITIAKSQTLKGQKLKSEQDAEDSY